LITSAVIIDEDKLEWEKEVLFTSDTDDIPINDFTFLHSLDIGKQGIRHVS
jgi:hypothetical protein